MIGRRFCRGMTQKRSQSDLIHRAKCVCGSVVRLEQRC